MAKVVLLSGNEAIARGAYEAGVRVVAGYPGTPGTEVVEAASQYTEVYTEWSTNEKVALEVGIGCALGGRNALVVMKHVGLNVAADPLMTVSNMRLNGAIVIVSADDPGMWSSQNEQDNRMYARFAKIPMFEPADSQEALDMTVAAFRLSRQYGLPVLIRTTTRLAHTRCPVVCGKRSEVVHATTTPGPTLDPKETVMIPAHARALRPSVEQRLFELGEEADRHRHNIVVNRGAAGRAFITSGLAYQYVREAFRDSAVLKLGLSYPLATRLIKEFCTQHEDVYVIEELEPLMQTEIRAMGFRVKGKELLTSIGEYSSGYLQQAILGKPAQRAEQEPDLPPRPPQLCAGCPHRGLFWALSLRKTLTFGDIGCYTLAVNKPLEAVHSCTCMGASMGHAHGMQKALGEDATRNHVAVLGDSTFFHSGITGLLNAVYNNGCTKLVIADNRTTAMTGHQGNPGSGLSAMKDTTPETDIEALVRALGVKNVNVVDPYDLEATRRAVDRMMDDESVSVLISRRECALLKTAETRPPVLAVPDACRECGICFGLGCPALHKIDGKAAVDASLCNGCTMCVQVCPFGALEEAKNGC